MKTLARLGAVLSFTFFLLSGTTILANSGPRGSGDYVLATALGFFLVGMACFVGPLLWLTGEKWFTGKDDR